VAVEGMRLACLADDSQCASKCVSEPIPSGAEQLGYSPVKGNSLGLSMVSLIAKDVGHSQ